MWNIVCSVYLARLDWVSTFKKRLYTEHHNVSSERYAKNLSAKFRERRGSNPRLLVEKHKPYLFAMLPPPPLSVLFLNVFRLFFKSFNFLMESLLFTLDSSFLHEVCFHWKHSFMSQGFNQQPWAPWKESNKASLMNISNIGPVLRFSWRPAEFF